MHDRICERCKAPYTIVPSEQALLERLAPKLGEKQLSLPLPTRCPDCRLRARMVFRNNNYVFLRPSSLTNKQIFSWYLPDTPFPVVENSHWWSDAWDALEHGRELDFSRPFFEQFAELRDAVPHPALSVQNLENSDYCNNANDLKNCYFVFNSAKSEDSFYSDHIDFSRDCIDCSFSTSCELCFDCIDCLRCYSLQSSESCEQCRDSYFLVNCRNCEHCIGCANLRHAKYCIFNKQVTPAEYFAFVESAKLDTHSGRERFHEQCAAFFSEQPRPHLIGSRVEESTGNYLHGVKHVEESFLMTDAEECRYCFDLHSGVKNCLDVTLFGFQCEMNYQCSVVGHDAKSLCFCYQCYAGASNLLYCAHCASTSDCFGCVGVRRKQYCILNKQYTRDEYYRLAAKIVEHMQTTGEWGRFFPESLTPFPYNLTLAQRYFPETREQILGDGLAFHELTSPDTKAAIEPSLLPDALPPTDESLVTRSAVSGRSFRITTAELRAYRKLRIPLPRLSYDERIEARARKLGSPRLVETMCAKTQQPISTTRRDGLVWERERYQEEFDR